MAYLYLLLTLTLTLFSSNHLTGTLLDYMLRQIAPHNLNTSQNDSSYHRMNVE